jgi:hypothetical protein
MTMLMLASFFVTIGIVLISMGLLAELLVRIYHGSENRTYVLEEEVRPSQVSHTVIRREQR